MLATSLPWKTGNESGCYQPLQHLVTPVRWHRAQLLPASPVTGSQQCCERASLCQACIKQKEERDRKEKKWEGGRKGERKKRQHPYLSRQRAVEDLGEVSGSSGSFPHRCSQQVKPRSGSWLSSQNTQSRGGWCVGITGSWDPRRWWNCKHRILSPSLH